MKFARSVQFLIKSGKEKEFTRLFDTEVLPVLRQQPGFKNQLILVHENRGMGISLWNDKGAVEQYQTSTYPRILEKLNPVMEGVPKVETFEVTTTTLTA